MIKLKKLNLTQKNGFHGLSNFEMNCLYGGVEVTYPQYTCATDGFKVTKPVDDKYTGSQK